MGDPIYTAEHIFCNTRNRREVQMATDKLLQTVKGGELAFSAEHGTRLKAVIETIILPDRVEVRASYHDTGEPFTLPKDAKLWLEEYRPLNG